MLTFTNRAGFKNITSFYVSFDQIGLVFLVQSLHFFFFFLTKEENVIIGILRYADSFCRQTLARAAGKNVY